jgi:predicted nucleic-acid-binding Zn-ribbon protein
MLGNSDWYRISYDARVSGAIGIFDIHKFHFIEAYSPKEAYTEFYKWARFSKLDAKINFMEYCSFSAPIKLADYL